MEEEIVQSVIEQSRSAAHGESLLTAAVTPESRYMKSSIYDLIDILPFVVLRNCCFPSVCKVVDIMPVEI